MVHVFTMQKLEQQGSAMQPSYPELEVKYPP